MRLTKYDRSLRLHAIQAVRDGLFESHGGHLEDQQAVLFLVTMGSDKRLTLVGIVLTR